MNEYAHAAMERTLASSGAALPPHWALQDLADCIRALQRRSRPRCARSGSAGEGAQGVQDGRDVRDQNDSGQFAVA
jgi:hypothetical protein